MQKQIFTIVPLSRVFNFSYTENPGISTLNIHIDSYINTLNITFVYLHTNEAYSELEWIYVQGYYPVKLTYK